METTLCCKGQSLHRPSDYHWLSAANTSHTITRTVSVTSLQSCRLADSLEVEMIESIAAWGSCWRGELLFSIARVIMTVNGQLCYRGVAQFRHVTVFVLQDNGEEISSQSISTVLQRNTSRRPEEQNKSPQLIEPTMNYWWRWQQQCSEKSCSLTLESVFVCSNKFRKKWTLCTLNNEYFQHKESLLFIVSQSTYRTSQSAT